MNNSKTSLGSDTELSENKNEKEKLTKKTRKQQKANFKSRLLELDETFDQKRKSNSQVGSPRSQTGDESSKKLISQSDDDNEQKEKEANQKRSRTNVNKSSESVKTSSNVDVKKLKSNKKISEDADEEQNKKETETEDNQDVNEAKEKKTRKRTRRTKPKIETEPKLEDENDSRILGIIVHQTDKLKTDISIYHPVVRIHIIDLDSNGEYVRKSNKDLNVAVYYEKDNKKYDYIPPIMTTPFDFKEYNSMIPRWEEIIVFNEKFNHFITSSPNVLIMFEILDLFKPDLDFKHSYTSQDTSKHWQRIAWAFLKVVGLDKKSLNIEKKVRLQLYYCQTNYKQNQAESLVPEIYNIYKNGPKIKYPASLHVTIKSILPPRQFNPCLGSNFLIESKEYVESSELYNLQPNNANDDQLNDPNAATKRVNGSKVSLNREILNEEAVSKNKAIWSRIAGLPCRVPNELDMTLNTTKNGCYSVKFSNFGNYLACACVEENTVSTVFIYNIPSGRLVMKAYGHLGLIYEIDWSKADKYILTASNDSTARVFDIENRSKEAYKILPHPSFVYAAKFHPKSSDVVCTSGYDRVVRVWSLNSKKKDRKYGELVQEIFGHVGYINSICFSLEGNELYSADSNGYIFVWNSYFHEDTNQLEEWTQKEEMKIEEIKNQCISYIHLHPNGFRLIVHMRQNQIYLVDIRLKSIVKEYKSLFNFNQNVRSAITPCGTFLFSAGADTKIYCWNIDTGDLVTTSSVYLNYLKPARDIDFHPHDNFIVLCSYDSNAPVYLFTYNPDKAVKDLTMASNLNQTALSLARTRGAKIDQTITETDEIYSTLKTLPAQKEESELQRRLAEENAQFNAYQANKWKNVQERLDSVYPLERRNQNGVVKRSALASSITLSINDDNKPEFKYKGPKEAQDIVIALYDYKAQRSDELNFNKGDEIRVLVKENENWWMGELIRTKQEGYFPAGYVQEKNVFDQNLRTNVFTQIRMPKFSARDLVSEYEKVYEENALDSISKATSKLDNVASGPSAKESRKSVLNPIIQTSSTDLKKLSNQTGPSQPRTDQVDVINEIPSRDESSRKRETPIKRRPFAHIINGNQQSSSDA